MTDYRSEYNDSLNPKSDTSNGMNFITVEGHAPEAQQQQLHAYDPQFVVTAPPVTSTRNNKAVISFILSLVGLVGGIATGVLLALAIPGVILGHIAYKEVSRHHQAGKGFALAGIILGYCSITLTLILAIIVALIFILAEVGIAI
jgi:hypothetical protein